MLKVSMLHVIIKTASTKNNKCKGSVDRPNKMYI